MSSRRVRSSRDTKIQYQDEHLRALVECSRLCLLVHGQACSQDYNRDCPIIVYFCKVCYLPTLALNLRLMHPERNAELNKNKLFKSSHVHHPITKWLLVCKPNWSWTVSMAGALHDEWKKRYNHPEDRVHKSYAMVQYLEKNPPTNFETDR